MFWNSFILFSFRARNVNVGFGSLSSQGTKFGNGDEREVSSQSIMMGLSQASLLKKKCFSPIHYSQQEEKDESIDFGSTMYSSSDFKVIGCPSKTGRKGSSATTSSAASSTTTSGNLGSVEKTVKSSGVGSGPGSNDDQDREDERNNGRKSKKPKMDIEDNNFGEEDEDEEDEHAGGDNEHAGGDNKHAGGDNEHVGGDNEHAGGDNEHTGGDNEHAGGDNEHAGGDNQHVGGDNDEDGNEAVGGEVDAEESAQGKFVWRTSTELNQETFPSKSKAVYLEAYRQFETFLKGYGQFDPEVAPSEESFMNYFSYLRNERHFASTSIWCTSAKLNACLKRKFGKKLQDYPCVTELLKTFDSDHVVKKAKNFSPQEV